MAWDFETDPEFQTKLDWTDDFVRRMLPESVNQFISLFKATTIVSLIAVPDLMYQVSMITQQEMRPLPL